MSIFSKEIPEAQETHKYDNSDIVWKDSIARMNMSLLKPYWTHRGQWATTVKKLEGARYARQFSEAEKREILRYRQAPLAISVSTAIADAADAYAVSARPTIDVKPIFRPGKEVFNSIAGSLANLYKYGLQKDWYDSLGSLAYSRIQRDKTNVGVGWMRVVPKFDNYHFRVEYQHESWRWIFPDPSCTDPLNLDAEATIKAMDVTRGAAYMFTKELVPDLTKKQFTEDFAKGAESLKISLDTHDYYGQHSTADEDDVPIIILTTIEDETSFEVIPLKDDVNRDDIDAETRYIQNKAVLDQAVKAGRIKLNKVSRPMLVEYISVGNLGFKRVTPINLPNIVPFYYDHVDNPYPYGRMWYIYPLQRALNKFIMTAILNSSIMNNLRIMAEEGSIINESEWIKNASLPGVILKYKLAIPGISQPPIPIEPRPLGEAWLTMPRYMVQMMEYVSGLWGIMQGNAENTPDVFSIVASLQSAGGMKMKKRAQDNDASLTMAGKIAGAYYREYAPLNGFTFKTDSQTGLEIPDEEPMLYNQLEVQTYEEDGMPKKRVGIKPETDLRRGFRDMRWTTEASMGNEAATQAQILSQVAAQTNLPGIIPHLMKIMNIPGTDEIVKDIQKTVTNEGKVEDLEKQVKYFERRTNILQNHAFQLIEQLKGAQAKGIADAQYAKILTKAEEQLKQLTETGG